MVLRVRNGLSVYCCPCFTMSFRNHCPLLKVISYSCREIVLVEVSALAKFHTLYGLYDKGKSKIRVLIQLGLCLSCGSHIGKISYTCFLQIGVDCCGSHRIVRFHDICFRAPCNSIFPERLRGPRHGRGTKLLFLVLMGGSIT